MLFRKAKNLVGLDIGSSAVKLVELKEGKEGTFQLVKAGLEILSPEAIVDGAIMDSSLVVETISRLLASTGRQEPERGRVGVRPLRHRQEDHAAHDAGGGALRVHPVGSRAVRPVRHQRRLPRLRRPRPRRRRRDDGRPPRGRQEGEGGRLQERRHAGGAHARPRRRGRLRAPELLRGELRSRSRAASWRS